MKITSQTIADLAGVSRGTVDRALNNRGKVKAEVKERILKIAEELNYRPNRAARALVNARRRYDVRFIIHNTRSNYWNEMKKSFVQSANEYQSYGLNLDFYELESEEPDELLTLLETCIKDAPDYLIVPPYNSKMISQKLSEILDCGIPLITVDSTIENNPSPCHIATDAALDGRIMAGLFSFVFANNIPKIVAMYRYLYHLTSERRTIGFYEELDRLKQKYSLVDTVRITGLSQSSYHTTRNLLEKVPDLDALFIASGNVEGVCNAIIDTDNSNKIKVFAYDIMGKTRKYLDNNTVTVTLCQANHRIAEAAMKKIADELIFGIRNDEKLILVENVIKLAQSPE